MNPARSPPKVKRTPSTEPRLLIEWQRLYEELSRLYPKSRALEIIGQRYGVSRQTVMTYLSAQYRQYQKNFQSKRWFYEKQDAAMHQKRIAYGAKYVAARRQIDKFVKTAFEKAEPQQTMTLEELACGIEEICGVFFKPSTLLGLDERFKARKGYPLLVKIFGNDEPHYGLSEEFKN